MSQGSERGVRRPSAADVAAAGLTKPEAVVTVHENCISIHVSYPSRKQALIEAKGWRKAWESGDLQQMVALKAWQS